MVPEARALQVFFAELLQKDFAHDIVLRDPQVQDYIAPLLVDFSRSDHMFKITDAYDRPLSDVGEMLLQSDPIYGPAPSFDRERQVRKHIGDYVLFLSGMFPESINHYRLRRTRLENMLEFLKVGKESYYIVSKFEHFEYKKVAPIFRKLSQNFQHWVYGLNAVKNHLRDMQSPIFREERPVVIYE